MEKKYAVIKTGGKQYRVEEGDVIDVELLGEEAKEKISFSDVLFIHDGTAPKIGAPFVANAIVHGEVVDEVRGPKVISYKYKKRKNYRRKIGHRQNYTRVKITEFAV
ncbi:MAG: 50S ribosomal protein L21 [Chlamydiae bacterium]|nr:50S ribosomal protein L21 [Chlamydiota bacterium]